MSTTVFGFIGAGNLVSAIVKGAFAAGFFTGEDCLVTDQNGVSGPALAAATGGQYVADTADLVKKSDVLVLGVKPQQILKVLTEISLPLAERKPLVISLAAGTQLSALENAAPADTRFIRMMPNVNAAVQESMTGIVPGTHCADTDIALAQDFANTFGQSMKLLEAQLPIFTALAGSSPAWIFDLIDAFAMAGVKYGVSKANASTIITQAIFGSAKLVKESTGNSDKTAANLIDQVCSPGGTTIAGLLAMQANGSRTAVLEAVRATIEQDLLLGKK